MTNIVTILGDSLNWTDWDTFLIILFCTLPVVIPGVLLAILHACKLYTITMFVGFFSALFTAVFAVGGFISFSIHAFGISLLYAAATVIFMKIARSSYRKAFLTEQNKADIEYRPETTNQTEETTADTQQTSDDENERGGGE